MVDYSLLPGSLDLFELMVNYVSGDILLSIVLWAGILLITGIMGKLSLDSIMVIIITFLVASSIGYFGSLYSGILLMGVLIYMIWGIVNWINSMR